MPEALQLILTLITQVVSVVLPRVGTSDSTVALISTIIATVEKLLPDIISAGDELVTSAQNIIAALKGSDVITQEQWAELDSFEKQLDDEFDAAAKDEGV